MRVLASELIGQTVEDRDRQSIGRVSDLILSSDGQGRVCYLLVRFESRDGDVPEGSVAIPWGLVAAPDDPRRANRDRITVKASAAALRGLRPLI